jgi:hypothetical protein
MVTSVGMFESEIGHRATNPFTAHKLSIILFMMKLLQLKALFKKGRGIESFNL